MSSKTIMWGLIYGVMIGAVGGVVAKDTPIGFGVAMIFGIAAGLVISIAGRALQDRRGAGREG
jgi:hypothetical protein